jgi:pentapeptide repeat protein
VTPRTGKKVPRWEIVAGTIVTLLGLIVAANGFEDSRSAATRSAGEDSFYQLVSNLGSESVVVRVGAIGQIEGVLVRPIPVEGHPQLWEGLLYVLGFHEHKTQKPYHEDLLRVISALLLAPKADSEASRLETEALLTMLCKIGPEGWYKAEPMLAIPVREECLSWVWKNAPDTRLVGVPSYRLFRSSDLYHANLERYNLSRADFSGSFLGKSSFSGSRLQNAQFRKATIRGVSFVNTDLRGSSFVGAELERVEFAGSDLAGADFNGANLVEVGLERVRNIGLAVGLEREASQMSSRKDR